MKRATLSSSIAVLMGFTLLAKLFGLARELIMAYTYGTSTISDAYTIGTSTPYLLFYGISMAVMTAYVPLATETLAYGKNALWSFSGKVYVRCFCVLFPCSIISCFLMYPLLKVFAPGFDASTLNIAYTFSIFSSISAIFVCFANLFIVYAQLHGSFFENGLYSLALNALLIASYLFAKQNILFLGLGYLISYVIPSVILGGRMHKLGFKFVSDEGKSDLLVNQLFMMAIPIFVGQIAVQLNGVIDRAFASHMTTGVVSALKYGNLLCTFAVSMFATSITTVMYYPISRCVNTGDFAGIRKTLIKISSIIVLIAIPIIICFITLPTPIVRVLFERGSFDQQSTRITSEVLAIYALGILAISLAELYNRVFYSLRDSHSPVRLYLMGILLNILLNFIFSKLWGYLGLAIASSIANTLIAVLLMLRIYKKLEMNIKNSLWTTLLKSLLASVGMAFTIVLITKAFDMYTTSFLGKLICVFVPAGVGILVYIGVLYLLKTYELYQFMDILKKKF